VQDRHVNPAHLELCSSTEWSDAVRQWIVPWALDGVDLGSDVLEVGPGPGATTDVLQSLAQHLTVVEIDDALADALRTRLPAHVEVVTADATGTGLAARSFDTVISLTMLHHVPTDEQQDAILAEAWRLLRSGGCLVGSDSRDGSDFRTLHEGDVCNPLDPATLAGRLIAAGFSDVEVETNEWAVRFRGRKP
jgi:SAM-dependent methyltransferase